MGLPRGPMGWSAMCDCGIYYSYSLAFLRSLNVRRQQFNPFLPSGIYLPYQLDESILNLRIVTNAFKVKSKLCMQTTPNVTWFCTVCRAPSNRR